MAGGDPASSMTALEPMNWEWLGRRLSFNNRFSGSNLLVGVMLVISHRHGSNIPYGLMLVISHRLMVLFGQNRLMLVISHRLIDIINNGLNPQESVSLMLFQFASRVTHLTQNWTLGLFFWFKSTDFFVIAGEESK